MENRKFKYVKGMVLSIADIYKEIAAWGKNYKMMMISDSEKH